MKSKVILLILFYSIFNVLHAQEKTENTSLKIKLPSSIIIKGTSTLHDWESIVEKTDAQLKMSTLSDTDIETLNIEIEVLSIKSGKRIMDKLTYKALKVKEHPTITFIFKKGEILSENTDFIEINLNGDLTIAGVTKNVSVTTKMNRKGKVVTLKGSHKLKMTDFGISPPKALLGTIKTGDEITIEFNLTFE